MMIVMKDMEQIYALKCGKILDLLEITFCLCQGADPECSRRGIISAKTNILQAFAIQFSLFAH